MELKDKLKKLRTDANLTQEDLANQIFVSRTLISKWESGDRYPSKDSLARLAIAFQVAPEELIGDQMANDRYKRYRVLSIVYSVLCILAALLFAGMFLFALVERMHLGNGWTGIGGFVFSITLGVPIITVLVVIEMVMLKKKNGYKTLELYSLLALILTWLLSVPAYLYMV